MPPSTRILLRAGRYCSSVKALSFFLRLCIDEVCAQSADSPWYLHVRQKAARKRAVAVFAAIATMPTRGLNALRAALSSAYLRQLKQRATAAKLAKAKVATPQWPVTMLFA